MFCKIVRKPNRIALKSSQITLKSSAHHLDQAPTIPQPSASAEEQGVLDQPSRVFQFLLPGPFQLLPPCPVLPGPCHVLAPLQESSPAMHIMAGSAKNVRAWSPVSGRISVQLLDRVFLPFWPISAPKSLAEMAPKPENNGAENDSASGTAFAWLLVPKGKACPLQNIAFTIAKPTFSIFRPFRKHAPQWRQKAPK